MTTNKFFTVILAIALIAAACSRNEELIQNADVNRHEISFRIQGGVPDTRTTASTVNNIDAFVVYAAETNDWSGQTTNQFFFNGVTVSRKVGTNDFDYSPKRYYSENPAIAFFLAYSPVSSNFSINDFTFSNIVEYRQRETYSYTVPVPNNSGNTTQEDLLIAHYRGTSTPIHFNFTHALSRIFVSATNSTESPVTIHSLTLKNFVSKGTLNTNVFRGSGSPIHTIWTPEAEYIADYPYILAPTGVAVPEGLLTPTLVTSMEQGMMVLPQPVRNLNNDNTFNDRSLTYAGDTALEVEYTFAGQRLTSYILLNTDYYPNGWTSPLPFEFEYNKQYVINIGFTGQAIDFTISVSAFEDPIPVYAQLPPPPSSSPPRITWNAAAQRYALTTDLRDAGLYFKFGSAIGVFSGTGRHTHDLSTGNINVAPHNAFNLADHLTINLSTTTITDAASIPYDATAGVFTIDAQYHENNMRAGTGLGDPCRLVGLNLNALKIKIENGEPLALADIDNGLWRLPTPQEWRNFSEYPADIINPAGGPWWWATGSTPSFNTYGIAGAEFPERGQGGIGKFLPAAGSRSNSGLVSNQGLRGTFLSNTSNLSSAQFQSFSFVPMIVNITATDRSHMFCVMCVPQ